MPGTIVEKVFQEHVVRGRVEPGEIVECSIDLLMMHEMLGDQVARIFREAGLTGIWDADKVVTILDHWVPASSEKVARIHQEYRNFVRDFGLVHDLGLNSGICHVAVPEAGFVKPGMFVLGTDSHTTSYGALNCFSTGIGATDAVVTLAKGTNWFRVPETVRVVLEGRLENLSSGKDVALSLLRTFGTSRLSYKSLEIKVAEPDALPVAGRFTIANMGVEMGCKCTIFEGDALLDEWLQYHLVRQPKHVFPAADAMYEEVHEIDLSTIVPMVAVPHSPANGKPAREVAGVPVDQVFIGSCTNGRLEDLEIVAKLLGDRKIHEGVRCIIIPASRAIYLMALEKGFIEQFVKAGAIVEYPTCGPCMGGHMGILGPEEVCLSTSNRNFKGRMGAIDASIYLASPATAIATAITGKITDPRDLE